MKYRVDISLKAEADITEVLDWFRAQGATQAGSRWAAEIWQAIGTLEVSPDRCSLASEFALLRLEIRELLFGRRRGRYRILFQTHGKTVFVLGIRHGARDALKFDDL